MMDEGFRQDGNQASASHLSMSAHKSWEGHGISRRALAGEHVFLLIFPGNTRQPRPISKERKSPMEPTRLIIADDHPLFRYGLRTLLQAEGEVEVVGEATDRKSV